MIWLERARGRKRLALALAYVVIAAAALIGVWWAASLNGLPDVGDPFDITRFTGFDVPDAENAFVLYGDAQALLKPLRNGEVITAPEKLGDWTKASPADRAWLHGNRAALGVWRRGTERPEALVVHPRDVTLNTSLRALQDLRDFTRLAILEGLRLEADGDVAGAWGWYRAALRSSRHARMHGGLMQGLVGAAIHNEVSGRVSAWAAHPRTDASLLRAARDEYLALEAESPPESEMLRVEYLIAMRGLDDPEVIPLLDNETNTSSSAWYEQLPPYWRARRFLKREPERSRRVIRLAFANWLAHLDKPRDLRPAQVTFEGLNLYAPGPSAAAPARALPPEDLGRWFASTEYARVLLPSYHAAGAAFARQQALNDAMILLLAEHAYRRDHGAPPRTLGELVGPYLERLPEGYTETDGSMIVSPAAEGEPVDYSEPGARP